LPAAASSSVTIDAEMCAAAAAERGLERPNRSRMATTVQAQVDFALQLHSTGKKLKTEFFWVLGICPGYLPSVWVNCHFHLLRKSKKKTFWVEVSSPYSSS
jgi:hypothetical protein